MNMQRSLVPLFLLLAHSGFIHAAEDAKRASNTVILDQMGVKNLRLETVEVEERDFEQTVFAIGRVEEIPGNQYSVSSRIAGRAIAVNAFIGDSVKKGQVLVRVESRQPGDPPPTIELTSPLDGLVTKSHVLQGQPVEPNQDLLDISNRTQMWVVARIPEQRAAGIGPGTGARIRFPALGDGGIKAKLLRFGVKADLEAGAIEGVFVAPNPEGHLQPGMRAEFDIIVSTRPNVIAVPEEAVQGDPASRVVYVKDFEIANAFVKVPVVTGQTGNGWVEIKEGIFPGDEVVTQGSYMLGFAGGGSVSLKEALDAAHGHAHSEDGSELKSGGDPGEETEHDHNETAPSGGTPKWFVYYASGSTLLLIVFVQLWWNLKKKGGSDA